jgi:uncharacterized protein (TIGR00299 family) protein
MGHDDHEHDEGHEHGHSHSDGHPHAHAGSHASLPTPTAMFTHTFTGVKQVLHVDPVSGAAGDMLIAALLDLGVDESFLRAQIDAIGLGGFRLELGTRDKHAIAARSFDVIVEGKQPARDYATIEKLLRGAALDARVHELAQHAFLRLGEAEAKIHRQPLSHVHFHEVGGVDAIVDIVGACAGVAWLETRAGGEGALGVSLSALPVGAGRTRGAHGSIPVPAPAALELMIGLPTRDPKLPQGQELELVTPTGAALLRTFVERLPSSVAGWPRFSPRAIGYGAGKRDLADRPNVVRLVLGDVSPPATRETTHVVLEANVDDTTGEIAGAVIEALLAEGALDAWAQPITMKKGRPALLIAALASLDDEEKIGRALLAHTGSLGVRRSPVSRFERPRRFVDVETPYGDVRVKIADGDGLPTVVHPELDECRARAIEHAVPVREVIRAAIVAVSRLPPV